MCIFIKNQDQSFIADRDIYCWKQLKEERLTGKLVTAFQEMPVQLGQRIKPGGSLEIKTIGKFTYIASGVIHAWATPSILRTLPVQSLTVTALIPKGTRCWIGSDLTEIGAEQMILSESKEWEATEPDYSYLRGLQRAGLDEGGKGILLSKRRALGCEVVDGKIFSNQSFDKEFPGSGTGIDHCKYFLENYPSYSLPAIEWARERGGYIPSVLEFSKYLLGSYLEINLTRVLDLGLKPILQTDTFWTSSIHETFAMWTSGGLGSYRERNINDPFVKTLYVYNC